MNNKRRIIAAVMAAALIGSFQISTMPVVAEDVGIKESNQNKNNTYYIFYKDIDTKEIDETAAQKRHDYIYSLYEQGLSEREVEQKSTDYYQEIRLDLVKKAYKEASASILSELGIESTEVFCSSFTPLIICSLTEEQLGIAQKSENIKEITSFTDFTLDPTTVFNDKNAFIEYFTTDSEGNSVLGDNIKVDAIFNSGNNKKNDYLIVYGLSDVKEIDAVVNKLNKDRSYYWESPIDTFSGGTYELIGSNIKTNNRINLIVFVDDIAPGFAVKDIADYSNNIGFDAKPYVINLGDANGDYIINAVDASDILSAYSQIQTTTDYVISKNDITKMDVNKNGSVDAVDASAVLSYYAYISTGGNGLLKDFLKKDNSSHSSANYESFLTANAGFGYENGAYTLFFIRNGNYFSRADGSADTHDEGTWTISGDMVVLTGKFGINRLSFDDNALIYIAEGSDGFNDFNPKDGEKFNAVFE